MVHCFAACVLHMCDAVTSTFFTLQPSHLESINALAATKAVNSAMSVYQQQSALHSHLHKSIWMIKVFSVALHITVEMDVDTHFDFTAGTPRPGCSLTAHSWHDSCSTPMFHSKETHLDVCDVAGGHQQHVQKAVSGHAQLVCLVWGCQQTQHHPPSWERRTPIPGWRTSG